VDNASLYERLFDNQLRLCSEFHISPFQIRRERFSEFCLLIKRTNSRAERLKKQPQGNTNNGQKKKKFLPIKDYKPIKKEVAKNG
jgi:hypothetical protein